MELIRGIYNIRPRHQGCVLSIGNYDGVHLGHIALIQELKSKAKQHRLPVTIILFEPQPNEFFSKTKMTTRLMKLREKIIALKKQGVERVLCIRFDEKFAAMTAQQFIEDILIEKLGTKVVIIGDDFRFGAKRQGDTQLLRQYHDKFETIAMPTYLKNGERVSSTRIRDHLAAGEMQEAAMLLGKSFTMMGRIIHGDKRGRIIGFPTANIQLHRKAVPLLGVFVVRVHGLEKNPLQGVANLGTRPTVDGTKTLLEIHLFNFDRMIYGEHIEVEFIHKLRDEARFASFDDLVKQIHQDAMDAKAYFAITD